MKKPSTLFTILLVAAFLGLGTAFSPLLSQTEVPAGDVSGIWDLSGSPYYVLGDITVPDGQTLAIEPGVEVIFKGHDKFIIHGRLLALGAKESAIIFTAEDFQQGWQGMEFDNIPVTNDTSRLLYCTFELARHKQSPSGQGKGGAITVRFSDKVVIESCSIKYNSTEGDVNSGGAGIGVIGSSPVISRNYFSYNNSEGGHGGGLLITNSSSKPVVANNLFVANSAYGGGAICVNESDPVFINNTVFWNDADHGGALDCISAFPTFINTIMAKNSASSVGNEVHFAGDYGANFLYCNIEGGQEAFAQSHQPGAPDYNGRYENNLEGDPLFDPNPPGFLLSLISPCIGAGTDQIKVHDITYYAPPIDIFGQPRPDPPGSKPDIGAIEHELAVPVGTEETAGARPSQLLPAYPSPVQDEARIPYFMAKGGQVTIEVHALSGEHVATLAGGYQLPGEHFLIWDTGGLANGVYVCTMKVGAATNSRMVVVQR